MITKFLSTKNGGGAGSVDYLLNERVELETARILRGDEQMTRDLIASMTKKQKVSVGVMSFEEENISEELKFKLMDEFEQTFMAGLEKEQFNVLWVEHLDKGRLELNAVIPKVELSTGRAFNPYNHKTDLHIKDLFQQKVNLEHGFSNPLDPAKEQTIQSHGDSTLTMTDYKELDAKLHQLVSDGVLQDRSDIIQALTENGIEVKRQGEDYLSVKLPESKKARRLKGGIYAEQFTSIDELGDIVEGQAQRERAFTSRDRQAEYREVNKRFVSSVAKRAGYNAEKYSRPKIRERKSEQRAVQNQSTVAETFRQTKSRQHEQARENSQTSPTHQEAREVESNKKLVSETTRGELDDRIRANARARAREREAVLQRIVERTRQTGEEIRRSAEESNRRTLQSIAGNIRSYAERVIKERYSSALGWVKGKLGELGETLERVGNKAEVKEPVMSVSNLEKMLQEQEELYGSVSETKDKSFNELLQELDETTKKKELIIDRGEEEQQPVQRNNNFMQR